MPTGFRRTILPCNIGKIEAVLISFAIVASIFSVLTYLSFHYDNKQYIENCAGESVTKLTTYIEPDIMENGTTFTGEQIVFPYSETCISVLLNSTSK
jgi:hypothetical protein